MGAWMVGIDTGGTFTDLIAVERASGALRLAKLASTPEDPAAAVTEALEQLFGNGIAAGDVSLLAHGTTVATNALLEGAGVPTGLLITRGFRAVYEARGWSQPRGTDLLDTFYEKPPLLAPQGLTEEVGERLDHRGEIIEPLDEEGLRAAVRRLAAKGVEAIAVCFLFSFLNSAHERRAAEIIAEVAPHCRISLSSTVLPVIREYPRLSTTVIDAYVGPKIERYLQRLEGRLGARGVTTPQLFLMQSNGGLMRLSLAARHPNQTLLSGPAAGVIAGTGLARLAGQPDVVTFDMGGTSTDISVIANGRVLETSEGQIAGQDLGTPMLRIRTLGAGGGTLAWIGKDGLLKVGPKSAGARPGPACYGRGGEAPTVTDANLLLGFLGGDRPLAGSLRLDEGLARRAVARIAEPLGLSVAAAAAGIIRIVNTHMAIDLRLALQEQGQDPRRFALVAFGGAGPLHAAALAREIGIPLVLVPLYPGINCAMGLLQTAVRHSYLRSAVGMLAAFPAAAMNERFADLEAAALAEAAEEGFAPAVVRLVRLLDLRYPHQGYSLGVECPAGIIDEAAKPGLKRAFDDLHRQVYGQAAPEEDAEIVTFRVQAEITVPQFTLPRLPAGDGQSARALVGERPIFDFARSTFVPAKVYDRARLQPGDRIDGPAVIDQFDATTLLLDRQWATVDPYGTLRLETEAT